MSWREFVAACQLLAEQHIGAPVREALRRQQAEEDALMASNAALLGRR